MTMMVREDGLLMELSKEAPSFPGMGSWPSLISVIFGDQLQTLPDQACLRGFLAHLMPFFFTLFPTMTISQPRPSEYSPSVTPTSPAAVLSSTLDKKSQIQIGFLDSGFLNSGPGVCLLVGSPRTLGSCLSSSSDCLQPSHSPRCPNLACDNYFSHLTHVRFPRGTKSGPHKCVVSFKQIFGVALQ